MKKETSKNIVTFILIIFTLSMAASYTLPVLFESVQEISYQIFQTVSTLTGSVLIGYFGKAGFENYDKNRKIFKSEKVENQSEGGNG